MAKWFITATVAVLCFYGVLAQSDTTQLPNDGKAVANVTDGDIIRHKSSSTFPPLTHNASPEDDLPTTESTSATNEPPTLLHSNVESESSTEKMKATNVPVGDVETTKISSKFGETMVPKSDNMASVEKTNNNSQNIIRSNSIILLFCMLLSKFNC